MIRMSLIQRMKLLSYILTGKNTEYEDDVTTHKQTYLSILFNKYIFRTPIQNLHGFFNRKYSLVIIRQNYDDN